MKTFELACGLCGGLLMGDEELLARVDEAVPYALSFALDEEGRTGQSSELPSKPWTEVYEKGTAPLRRLCARGLVFFENLGPGVFHCRLEEEAPGQPPAEGVSEVGQAFLHLRSGRLCVVEAGVFAEASEEAVAGPVAMLEVPPGGYEVSVLHMARAKERRTRGVFGDESQPALVVRLRRRVEEGLSEESLAAGNFSRKRTAWLDSWSRDSDLILGVARGWKRGWHASTSWRPVPQRRGPRILS
ncbi:MAG TPA: hypothetical protein VLQ93_24620 [Myxococcaceae bacterium]|nr:hypothetical protein [Myxococcaceae bacterium]